MSQKVILPELGLVEVTPDKKEPGHHWWLSDFGWHDCTRTEDCIINLEFGEETLPSPNGKTLLS